MERKVEESTGEVGNASGLYKIKPIRVNWMNKTDSDGRDVYANIWGKAIRVIVPEFHIRQRMYVTGLTAAEELWLEEVLVLPAKSLNKNNVSYWGNYKIPIPFSGKTFDISNPRDFLDWKIASVNSKVAKSSFDNNLPFAEFIMTNDEIESQNYNKIYELKTEAYAKFKEMSIKEMMDFTKVYQGGKYKVTHGHTPDQIKAIVGKVVDESPKEFLKIVENPSYNTLIFIQDSVIAGALNTNGKKYYITGEVDPIANSIEEAVEFFENPANQGIKLNLKSKVEVPIKKFKK